MTKQRPNIVELDVRPMLKQKIEPFQAIMEAVKKLDVDDMFVLHATFKPTPLFGVLKIRGFAGKAEKLDKDHWVSTFVNKKNKHWLDTDIERTEAHDQQQTDSIDFVAQPQREPKITELDNRGLEPPNPMIRTLTALEKSQPGDIVAIHNDRVPMFLIEELHSLGYPYTVEEQADGSAKVRITKT